MSREIMSTNILIDEHPLREQLVVKGHRPDQLVFGSFATVIHGDYDAEYQRLVLPHLREAAADPATYTELFGPTWKAILGVAEFPQTTSRGQTTTMFAACAALGMHPLDLEDPIGDLNLYHANVIGKTNILLDAHSIAYNLAPLVLR